MRRNYHSSKRDEVWRETRSFTHSIVKHSNLIHPSIACPRVPPPPPPPERVRIWPGWGGGVKCIRKPHPGGGQRKWSNSPTPEQVTSSRSFRLLLNLKNLNFPDTVNFVNSLEINVRQTAPWSVSTVKKWRSGPQFWLKASSHTPYDSVYWMTQFIESVRGTHADHCTGWRWSMCPTPGTHLMVKFPTPG